MKRESVSLHPSAQPGKTGACKVSVVIKALNEEKRIEATIKSALQAVLPLGGEVVLADSCSTDRTVEIARQYPIRIAELANPQERCCGAGPQLGWQHSRGEFIYLIDGDMQVQAGFLERALSFMAGHPDVAGVGGRIVEQNLDSLEYQARNEKIAEHQRAGNVDRLDGGGVYRRSAIESIGYFSNRNLHSYEEFDLAVRLREAGWDLWRMPVDAVSHFGHDSPPYQLLMRRWRSRYACGLGELLRSSLEHQRLKLVVQGVRELRVYGATIAWWLTLLLIPFVPLAWGWRLACFAAVLAAPVLLMSMRKRSFAKGLYAVTSWSVNAAGLIRGFVSPQKPPHEGVKSRVVHDAVPPVKKRGPRSDSTQLRA
ncbi:MAG: glycosyltransferase [Pseudomonadota bacterium]